MDRLYYISQGETPQTHLINIEKVCAAGVKLIQLRLKNSSFQDHLATAKSAKVICDYYGAQLIINDAVTIAKEVQSAGVHLGKEDISITEARTILGEKAVIGGTANTLKDCLKLITQKSDYIGLGPFKYTTTKKNLSPVLGIKGYTSIINSLRSENHNLPIYAIGGITLNDITDMLSCGVSGIAVSTLLSNKNSKDMKKLVDKMKAVL